MVGRFLSVRAKYKLSQLSVEASMFKSNLTRLEETLEYLRRLNPDLTEHLREILLAARNRPVLNQIGDQISLSGKTAWFANGRENNTETQRDALRALLLCQRVYLTNMWSNRFGAMPAGSKASWPDVTVKHWRFRPESEIRNAIRMYVKTNPGPGALADSAANRPTDDTDFWYTITRQGSFAPLAVSCYGQISMWLLHAGFVSMRWLAKHSPQGPRPMSNDRFDFSAFGPGITRIGVYDPMPAGRIDVPRGMIVRMFTDKRPGGHFMVSGGGGWGWGHNNSALPPGDGEGEVKTTYCRCLIHRQFAEYRERRDIVRRTPDEIGRWTQNLGGKMVILNPSHIPNADF
jgi:hypothetical protein